MFNSKKLWPRRPLIRKSALAALAAATVLLVPNAVANAQSGPPASTGQDTVAHDRGRHVDATASVPISFQVKNVNRSKVACASDGKTYTVRGHLVGPADMLRSGRTNAVTLYLHGLSFGEFFWDFQQAQGYDYAANQAAQGQVSVIVDRLGYNSSDKPNGNNICVGSRADIAHQMVQALRSGNYQVNPSGHGPRFSKVVLAGHSYGGQIVQLEAYSFHDIDGLIVISYADRIQSALLKANAAYATKVCAAGGLRVGATGPSGYAPFGPPAGAPKALFHSADPRVEAAALQLLTIDPCGDVASFAKAVKVDLANVRSIRVPVLVIAGGSDALFPPPAVPNQAALFTGSHSVSTTTLPGSAHAVAFERAHNQLVSSVANWLRQHVTGDHDGDDDDD
ncbi:alpha/beta hydrolase [Paenarthrobacter sp. Z7-10]|uniref:alpha/beta fold hydrolase n=1 Tax=Paenarthrobacter sp. Z7-10 TaxID=2787635 RepID=UPI0022A991DE|nr:alpha/beta hydrolase [Paenarthrobacter sp. Z7-10]MCZ2402241.1 alpha/beta hydrolase [Paenarthrobacter sp. Z7-10]